MRPLKHLKPSDLKAMLTLKIELLNQDVYHSFVLVQISFLSFKCKIPSTDDLNSSEFVDEILSLFGFQINATEQRFRVGLSILDYSGTKMIVNKDRHFFN